MDTQDIRASIKDLPTLRPYEERPVAAKAYVRATELLEDLPVTANGDPSGSRWGLVHGVNLTDPRQWKSAGGLSNPIEWNIYSLMYRYFRVTKVWATVIYRVAASTNDSAVVSTPINQSRLGAKVSAEMNYYLTATAYRGQYGSGYDDFWNLNQLKGPLNAKIRDWNPNTSNWYGSGAGAGYGYNAQSDKYVLRKTCDLLQFRDLFPADYASGDMEPISDWLPTSITQLAANTANPAFLWLGYGDVDNTAPRLTNVSMEIYLTWEVVFASPVGAISGNAP